MDIRSLNVQRFKAGPEFDQAQADEFFQFVQYSVEGYLYANAPNDIHPSCFLLMEANEKVLPCVSMEKAFDAPQVHQEATSYLRQYIIDNKAHAAAIVVPKSKIAFPQCWNNASKTKWHHGSEKQGVFVQLESKTARKILFVPYKPAAKAPETTEELDAQALSIMSALFVENAK